MKRVVLVSLLLLLLSSLAYAVEPGKATGYMHLNDEKIDNFAFSGARLKLRSFDESQTEVEVIVSDQPVTADDLADDTIAQSVGHLSVSFVKNAPWNYTLHFGYSETGAGEKLKFDGKVTDKAIVGRIYTDGVVSIFDGKDKLQFDVQVNAPIVNVVQKPATAAEKSAAAKSEQLKLYRAFLGAEEAEAIKPTISSGLAKTLEEYSGMVSLIRSDVAVADVVPLRVSIEGDNAVLHAETSDRKGTVRFVREGGAWKVRKETWKWK